MTSQVGPRLLSATVLLIIAAATPSHAAGPDPAADLPRINVTFGPVAPPSPVRIAFSADAAAAGAAASSGAQAPAVAFQYSDGYHTRARIHRIASFSLLPLFATQAFLGQSLYNDSTPGKKTAHKVVAGTIDGLFALNTVTGVWNLVEARKDPNGRTRRWAHGLLMMASDAAFLTLTVAHPNTNTGEGLSTSAHRALAFTAIGTATTGYLIMLIGNR